MRGPSQSEIQHEFRIPQGHPDLATGHFTHIDQFHNSHTKTTKSSDSDCFVKKEVIKFRNKNNRK